MSKVYLYLESASAVDTPATWTAMGKTENLKVVTLQTTDQEYQDVAKQFSSTSGGAFTITKVNTLMQYAVISRHVKFLKKNVGQNYQSLLREIITFLDNFNDKVLGLYSVEKLDPLLYPDMIFCWANSWRSFAFRHFCFVYQNQFFIHFEMLYLKAIRDYQAS